MSKAYHIHTTHSDGRLSVDEIIEIAKKQNVTELAICDHDTLLGCHEAYDKLKNSDFKLVPGIEISAKNRKLDIPTLSKDISLHILGYDFDLKSEKFNKLILDIRHENNKMCKTIFNNLQSEGINILLEDIKLPKTRHHYFKTDIAKHLVKLGKVHSVDEAFRVYINNDVNKYLHTYSLSIIDSIREIKQANGLAVWAHPFELLKGVSKIDISIEDVETILLELIKFGIDGLEVYYESYNDIQIRQLKTLCEKYSLLKFGGTDFHGRKNDIFVCTRWEEI